MINPFNAHGKFHLLSILNPYDDTLSVKGLKGLRRNNYNYGLLI